MEEKHIGQNEICWEEMKAVNQNAPPLKDELTLSQKTQQRQSKEPMLPPQTSPPTYNYKRKIISVVLGSLAVIIVLSLLKRFRDSRRTELDFQEGVLQYNTTLGSKYCWIRQILDHQSANPVYWKQRLLISNESYQFTTTTPIFLYIPQFSYIKEAQRLSLFLQQARKHEVLLLGLEQRYFGQSLPFGEHSHTLPNLQYLTIPQMVSDIATVINRIKSLKLLGISQSNPWIVNGYSLSGTITALFQAQYPGLAVGAVASSPLLPTALTPKIEELLYSKINIGGKICASIIKNILNDFETNLYSDQPDPKSPQYREGQPFTADEILYMVYYKLQVLERTDYIEICSSRNEANIKQTFNRFLFTDDYAKPQMESQQELANEHTWKEFQTVRDDRSVFYLQCSQVGLFWIAGNQHLLFPSKINEKFYRDKCRFVFGTDLWPDSTSIREIANKHMQFANNLLIVQGFYDINLPYTLLPQNYSNSTIVKILKCPNCQGSPDSFSRPTDRVIRQIRQFQSSLIDSWLQQHQKAMKDKSPQ